MKKGLSMLLAVLMLVSVLTFGVHADVTVEAGVEPFDDVAQSAWYHEGAIFCKINGYMNGTADYTFAPNMELTRAQMAVIFSVIAGVDTSEYSKTETPFIDVPAGIWYENAVKWMYANEVTGGMSDTQYGPNDLVTREQLCVFVKKLSEFLGLSTDDSVVIDNFTDKNTISAWALFGMKYAVAIGVISGFPDGTIGPKGNVTRAQMSVITKAYVLNTIKGDHEHDWADATCADPAVCKECGIKNGLPLGHDLDNACAGGECKRCHETVAAKDHDFRLETTEPTCTEAGKKIYTCRRCGKVEEYAIAALGHTTDNGICSRCGKEIFKSALDRIRYYVNANGEYYDDSGRVKGVYNDYYYDDGDRLCVSVYCGSSGMIYFETIYFWADGDCEQTGFMIDPSGNTCVYNEYYYDSDNVNESVEVDTGYYFNRSAYKRGDTIWLVNSDDPSLTDHFQARLTEYFPGVLDELNVFIKDNFSVTLKDIGFASFN